MGQKDVGTHEGKIMCVCGHTRILVQSLVEGNHNNRGHTSMKLPTNCCCVVILAISSPVSYLLSSFGEVVVRKRRSGDGVSDKRRAWTAKLFPSPASTNPVFFAVILPIKLCIHLLWLNRMWPERQAPIENTQNVVVLEAPALSIFLNILLYDPAALFRIPRNRLKAFTEYWI